MIIALIWCGCAAFCAPKNCYTGIKSLEEKMINSSFAEDISNKIKELIKSTPAADMEKNLRALLQGAFTKLELVTREEFEVQADVLRRTRQKLELLETKLAELESLLQKNNS
ncbi:MAG TPA: accessory factor UbiK family protein [Methylophilaceae bacterium]|nr:accessory factor UbiK family protein [Methylophilaceae bacterium]